MTFRPFNATFARVLPRNLVAFIGAHFEAAAAEEAAESGLPPLEPFVDSRRARPKVTELPGLYVYRRATRKIASPDGFRLESVPEWAIEIADAHEDEEVLSDILERRAEVVDLMLRSAVDDPALTAELLDGMPDDSRVTLEIEIEAHEYGNYVEQGKRMVRAVALKLTAELTEVEGNV